MGQAGHGARVWPTDRGFGGGTCALARWGDEALVNTYGERFPGRSQAVLPAFLGPAGTEQEVATRYAHFAAWWRRSAPASAGRAHAARTRGSSGSAAA